MKSAEGKEVNSVHKRLFGGDIRIAAAIGLFALVVLAAIAVRATFQSSPVDLASYTPLPHTATTSTGVTFVQLKPSQLAGVRVSDTQALAIARHWEAFSGTNPHITVDLGAFADSKNVPPVPAYLVIFHGVIVPSLGPKQERPNYDDIEVISAVTGHAIEGFSYH
jgi:hypothetical protein